MSSEQRNRLGSESSPYLLQHAGNPVHWWPWCDEAFAAARAGGKPVFLSIGYSTCHWCHVMAHESFEDEQTAALLNEHTIPIKVDREERPDVDQIYMQAVTMLTGQGGWPLSVWLDAERRPFWGGTYFPPERRWGRPSFRDVILHLRRVWDERADSVRTNAEQITLRLRASESAAPSGDFDAQAAALRAEQALERSFDAVHGGFGSAPKFPRPAALSLLLHRQSSAQALRMVAHTLESMSAGGIRDHLAGGFMRYSTDERWLVPHFEKMLYDNAQLIDVLLDTHLRTESAELATVLRECVGYVLRDLHPDDADCPAFAAAEDADSEGEEGRFHVFTLAELEAALGAEAPLAARVLGASAEGNFEGRNILHWPVPLQQAAERESLSPQELQAHWERWRARLLEVRNRRPRPLKDGKVIAAWNGLMIAALARCGAALGEPAWLQRAVDAAAFVHTHMRAADGSLLRIWCGGQARHAASLDDRAAMGLAYLTLFSTTGEAVWLQRARAMADEILARHGDDSDAALFSAEAGPDLIARPKEAYDGALPSGNSLAALLFARLGSVCRDETLRRRAADIVAAFGALMARAPEIAPLLLCAGLEAQAPPATLHLHESDVALRATWRLALRGGGAHQRLNSGCVIVPVLDSQRTELNALGVAVEGRGVLLCEQGACREWC